MSRLIVSGCSFTAYLQPTWPMFLSQKFNETYNLGSAGAGNDYIFNSIIDADSILKFNENDTVIIEWSGYHRLDQFEETQLGTRWITKGDLVHRVPDEFMLLNSYFSEAGLMKKTINYMLATYRYLKAKKVNFIFTSLYDLRTEEYSNLLEEMYNDCFVMPEGMEYHQKENINLQPQGWGHPTFSIHYHYAKILADRLQIELPLENDIQSIVDATRSENEFHVIVENNINTHRLYNTAILKIPTTLPAPQPHIDKYHSQTWGLYKKILQDVCK